MSTFVAKSQSPGQIPGFPEQWNRNFESRKSMTLGFLPFRLIVCLLFIEPE